MSPQFIFFSVLTTLVSLVIVWRTASSSRELIDTVRQQQDLEDQVWRIFDLLCETFPNIYYLPTATSTDGETAQKNTPPGKKAVLEVEPIIGEASDYRITIIATGQGARVEFFECGRIQTVIINMEMTNGVLVDFTGDTWAEIIPHLDFLGQNTIE